LSIPTVGADAAVYFAGQQEKLGVDSLENFEARHADQFARGALREHPLPLPLRHSSIEHGKMVEQQCPSPLFCATHSFKILLLFCTGKTETTGRTRRTEAIFFRVADLLLLVLVLVLVLAMQPATTRATPPSPCSARR
jgi:hypothetical protein